jgi:hypothetical protein
MHSIHRDGRLVLMRLTSPITSADTEDVVAQVRMNMIAAVAKVVFFADLTGAERLPPEAEDKILATFTRDNPKLERSAILVAPHRSGIALLLERLARDARNPNRRVFDQPEVATRWINELLTEAEQTSIREFLSAGQSSLTK